MADSFSYEDAVATAPKEPDLPALEQKYGLPKGLLSAIQKAEGSGDKAVSPKGAVGRFQFIPATARAYGLDDPTDPVASADAAARYMADSMKTYGTSDPRVLAAEYNGGPRQAKAVLAGAEPPAAETQKYIRTVANLIGVGDAQATSAAPAPATAPTGNTFSYEDAAFSYNDAVGREPDLAVSPSPFASPAAEGIAATVSGMAGKFAGDVAGLATIPAHALGLTKTMPQEVQRGVQGALTYSPRSEQGRDFADAFATPAKLLEKGVNWATQALPDENSPLNPLTAGAKEGLMQFPAFLGARSGAKSAAALPAKQAALDVVKGENAMKDAVRSTAQEAGYITPPEAGVKAAVSGLAGKTKAEKILSEKNEVNATRRLSQEVGVPDGAALSKEEFSRIKKETGKDYDAMTGAVGPDLQPTPQFKQALSQTRQELANALARNPVSNKPLREPLQLVQSFERQQFFPTAETLKDIQNQRKWAKDDFRLGNSEMGTARMGIANQLENMFEGNLAATGQQAALADFRAARERFAKIYLLERITNDATGRVDLQKLASLSDTKQYKNVMSGEFKTASDFAKTFRKASQRSTGEAAPRLTVFDYMFGIGSLMHGSPKAALAEMGGRLAIPMMAERGMLQQKGTPSYQVGAMRRSAPTLTPLVSALTSQQPRQATIESILADVLNRK